MKTQQIISDYRGIAEYVNDEAALILIDQLKKRLDMHEYFLPFIGQFSAGKSKLINRIIGRDILPTKRKETTAFLTYIYYSPSETAQLEYVDGTVEQVAIPDIKTLDNEHTQSKRPIAGLHIGLPVELLHSGLILVDTPGVNTLIKNHVKITEELLASAQYIVYVLSTPMSNFDRKMLIKIETAGIPLIFVRTHIDKINYSEEQKAPTEIVNDEKITIEECLGRKVDYYPLCNERTATDYDLWLGSYNLFIDFLKIDLADRINEVFSESVINRLQALKAGFLSLLTSKLDAISNATSKSEKELASQIETIKKNQEEMQITSSRHLKDMQKDCDTTITHINDKIQINRNSLLNSFEYDVDNADKENITNIINTYFETKLPTVIDQMGEISTKILKDWASKQRGLMCEDLNKIRIDLEKVDITFDDKFTIDIVKSYVAKGEIILQQFDDQYHQLEALTQKGTDELAQLGLDIVQVNELIAQYDKVIKHSQADYQAFRDNHVVMMREVPSNLAPIMKGAGQVLDLAMLLIPSEGWVALGAKMGASSIKAVQYLGEGAKAMAQLDSILDASKLINEGGKIIAGAEKMEEISKIAKEAGGLVKYADGVRKRANLLDYLSLSYWFEQAALQIDPPTYVVDEDAEHAFQMETERQRMAIEQQNKMLVEQEFRRGQILSEAARKKREIELNNMSMKKLNEQREQEYRLLEQKAQREQLSQTKQKAKEQFKKRLEGYESILKKQVEQVAKMLSERIIISANAFAQEQLSLLASQIEDIRQQIEGNKANSDAIKKEIEAKLALLNTLQNE